MRNAALLEWLKEKLERSQQSLRFREQSAETWSGGTAADWRAVGCRESKESRLKLAARDLRIAEKHKLDNAAIEALIQIVGNVPPDISNADDPQDTEDTDLIRKLLKWLAGPDTGLSSEAMAFCAAKIQRTGSWSGIEHPYDPSDFNRCLLLVEQVPEVRDHFPRIAELSDEWAAIIAAWDELKEMFVDEVGLDLKKGLSAPRTYQRMQQILGK